MIKPTENIPQIIVKILFKISLKADRKTVSFKLGEKVICTSV